MNRALSFSLAVMALAACASPPPPATVPPLTTAIPAENAPVAAAGGAPVASASELLSADAKRTTPAGTTFKAPGGWTLTSKATLVVLDAPEPDTHVALVDVKAADADAAVAAAWAAYRADWKRPLRVATPRAARNGWELVRVYEYETSPNERAVVYATAFKRGDAWTVLLVDASEMTFEKRLSQVLLVRESLRPQGYVPESFAGKKAHPLDAARIKILGEFIEAARKELGIPGVGLALIDGGKVVFEGGFGVRELGKPAPVDANTNFIIASNTKGMTTLLLAKLVDEGKLRWDEPVVTAMPGFKLGDADTTSKVQVKHLVCACTGLPRQDLEWLFEFKQSTPKSSMDLLGTMQPTSKFGEVFQYSNMLAAAGGYVAASIVSPNRELGAAYDDAMKTKVFDPLGMTGTTFDFARAERGDHARPHSADIDGKTRVSKMDINHAVVPVRPAGGAWSSVHDVAKYVQVELAKGVLPSGKRYISEEAILARRSPQVPVGQNTTYGMGLEVDTQWGVPVVHHGGSLFGYKSDLMFLPDYGVGAVVLTNADDGGAMLRPFLRRFVEVLFDGNAEALDDLVISAQRIKAERAKARERLTVPPDPAIVGKLASRYANASLGEVKIKTTGSTTVMDVGEWSSAVATRKNDDGTTSIVTIEPPLADDMDAVIGERNGKRVLIGRDSQHEYVFVEQ
jgi:CubicO group peptidase (beta-lactamase class C family)